jgi:hypothetical protein
MANRHCTPPFSNCCSICVAGHMYRTNWNIGHSMKILEAHKGPFTGEGHRSLQKF